MADTDHWFAILTTRHGRPQPGSRWLIAMPTPTSNPHAVGRILTADRLAGGSMPKFLLTIMVDSAYDAAAKREFRAHMAIDCYRVREEAERWHAVDEEHVARFGYGRNHWL